jgi:anti-anti-sigma factor
MGVGDRGSGVKIAKLGSHVLSSAGRAEVLEERARLLVTGEVDGRRAIVVAEGDLDLDTWSRFEVTVAAALRDGVTELALDLHQVATIDSSGLRCLVDVIRACQRRGLVLELLPSVAVAHMFEQCQVNEASTINRLPWG